MPSYEDVIARWEARRAEGQRLGAMVSLAAICDDVLACLRELREASNDVLSVKEASELGGYSEDHIRREIAAGHIPNAGRKNKPALRRADVPKKPGHSGLRVTRGDEQLSPRRRIVLGATTPPERSA